MFFDIIRPVFCLFLDVKRILFLTLKHTSIIKLEIGVLLCGRFSRIDGG